MPQGTVLVSLFIIIMIADIDQYLENSVSRLFADDTKVSTKIKTQEDTECLQQDPNKIYTGVQQKWILRNEPQWYKEY